MSVNKPITILGGTLSALSVGWIGYCVYQSVQTRPHSQILTDEVIEGVCHSEFLLNIGMIGVTFLLISIILLSLGTKWERISGGGGNAIVIMLAYFAIVVGVSAFILPPFVKKAIDIKTQEPCIEEVTLTDSYKKRSRRSTNYYAVFSNGSKDSISRTEFDRYSIGDEFYVIMCDNTCVEHFDVDQYELP